MNNVSYNLSNSTICDKKSENAWVNSSGSGARVTGILRTVNGYKCDKYPIWIIIYLYKQRLSESKYVTHIFTARP